MQRATDRDHTLESQIEIFRHIAPITGRPVIDERVRMNDTVFEPEAIDERLERGARRAQRLSHIHLPGTARV